MTKLFNYKVEYYYGDMHGQWHLTTQDVQAGGVDLDSAEDSYTTFYDLFEPPVGVEIAFHGVYSVQLMEDVFDDETIINVLRDAIQDYWDDVEYEKELAVIESWLDKIGGKK